MVAILRDKITYYKVSKYANALIFDEFYPKTKNVSYCLKPTGEQVKMRRNLAYLGSWDTV